MPSLRSLALAALLLAGCASAARESAPALREGRAAIAAAMPAAEAAGRVEAFLKNKGLAAERMELPGRTELYVRKYGEPPEGGLLAPEAERALTVYVYPEAEGRSQVRLGVVVTRFSTGQGFAAFTAHRSHDARAERELARELSEALGGAVAEMPEEAAPSEGK